VGTSDQAFTGNPDAHPPAAPVKGDSPLNVPDTGIAEPRGADAAAVASSAATAAAAAAVAAATAAADAAAAAAASHPNFV